MATEEDPVVNTEYIKFNLHEIALDSEIRENYVNESSEADNKQKTCCINIVQTMKISKMRNVVKM